MSTPEPLTTSEQVATLAAALSARFSASGSEGTPTLPRLAVDTEFHAERRYRPSLKLVQLAAGPDEAWVIDPLNVDLTPLGAVLEAAEVLVHGGQHDLALLERATGARPEHVLDSQILAGLVGHAYPARLDLLVEALLGQELPTATTLSDWSQRPLSAEQLAYATADAQVLFPLIGALELELEARGRLELARRACGDLHTDLPPYAGGASALDWRQLAVAPSFDEATRRVLQALFDWRESVAQARNQPPHYMLGNSLALQLARTRPLSMAELARDRRINSGLRKRFGTEILQTIAKALAPTSPAPAPVAPQVPGRLALLKAWAIAQAGSSDIAPRLALPDALARQIAREGPDVLVGWRRERFATPLKQLWQGDLSVSMRHGVAVIHGPGPHEDVVSADVSS